MEQVRISVRNLVEFILRSGDIDNRRGRTAAKDAMQEGSRIHRKLQRRMGASYHAEVPLKIEFENEKYTLVIEGRADGILLEEGKDAVIDEIKGVYQDVNFLEAPVPVHLAQAKCYAYMFAKKEELPRIGVQMTYCNLDTEELRYFREQYSFEELEQWFLELAAAYHKWADFQYEAKRERQQSIQGLEFPFPYRQGQRELAAGVYRTIRRGKNLFIQAPTGTGKTISAVFPAVRAVGEGLGEKIFYLTAKTITRTVAREAFDILRQRGYRGSVLTITAKEKLCLCEEMDCNPVSCPYAKGHYDRVNDAVFELICREKDVTREILLAQAKQHQVCPFEMCLDASLWMDDIICDYNYVFDPNVYLKRFFAEGIKGDFIFLIDEAHNLVERGREMYSAVLYKESFLELKKLLKLYSRKVVRELERCNKILLEKKRACEHCQELAGISDLAFALTNLGAAMDEFLQKNNEFPKEQQVLDFYLELRHFLNMYDRVDENYVIYNRHTEDGRFMVKLYCVNPSANLQECLDRGKSAVFFSATLLPIQYYKGLLSTVEDNYAVYAQTVFAREQSLVLVARDVSSKYTRRNQREFARIASYIQETVSVKKGNYIVFFPSYKMMEQVLACCVEAGTAAEAEPSELGERVEYLEGGRAEYLEGGRAEYLEGERVEYLEGGRVEYLKGERVEYLVQRPGMSEQEREEFLEAFSRERDNSLVGFCVMGGIFAEGIDLKDERLIGAIVVGTGLPQVSDERELLKNYYDEKCGEGFDYAFRYPGMNKVMQAAGRVIRTVTDKGVILLLDERFLHQDYRRLFPREWEGYQVCSRETVAGLLEAFWAER